MKGINRYIFYCFVLKNYFFFQRKTLWKRTSTTNNVDFAWRSGSNTVQTVTISLSRTTCIKGRQHLSNSTIADQVECLCFKAMHHEECKFQYSTRLKETSFFNLCFFSSENKCLKLVYYFPYHSCPLNTEEFI